MTEPARRAGSGGLRAAAAGTARLLGRTVWAVTLDLANAGSRAGEAAVDQLAGRPRGPGVLRVRVVVLADEAGRPLCDPAAVRPALDAADRIFTAGAQTRIRCAEVRVLDTPAPPEALSPRADRALLRDDLLGRTALYRRESFSGDSVFAPVTVVVVRSIAGRTTGCSLGISADWVVVEASLFDPADAAHYDTTVLAHELGHALNLPHHADRTNLMSPVSSPPHDVRGTALARWQGALVQGNRHVVPGVAPGGPSRS